MDVKIKPYSALPCELEVFTINGRHTNDNDFGVYEQTSASAEEYGCAESRFIPDRRPEHGVLEKYGITLDEWMSIEFQLEEALHVTNCGWCV